MTNVREIDSEIVVEGAKGGGDAKNVETLKAELREVVRELVAEMLERHLRVEEGR
ncbi:hypothetical protein [Sorangium sp. So ce1182]|uniref:hypothetical protein n=1 Tax=Sorangium sp. So ce1182 TaxID=3133334 RepID=UPI003F63FDD9